MRTLSEREKINFPRNQQITQRNFHNHPIISASGMKPSPVFSRAAVVVQHGQNPLGRIDNQVLSDKIRL